MSLRGPGKSCVIWISHITIAYLHFDVSKGPQENLALEFSQGDGHDDGPVAQNGLSELVFREEPHCVIVGHPAIRIRVRVRIRFDSIRFDCDVVLVSDRKKKKKSGILNPSTKINVRRYSYLVYIFKRVTICRKSLPFRGLKMMKRPGHPLNFRIIVK